jgi:sulfonate transport system permease protein
LGDDEPWPAVAPQEGRYSRLAPVRRWFYGLALPVGLALLWELAVRAGWSDGRLVPPPSRVFDAFADLWRSGELTRHVVATVMRVGAGFGLGVAAATLLGAVVGYSALGRSLLDPTLQALRAIPSIAWVPLFILWLGIFEASKVVLIAVGVFFPVYLGLMGAILSVDRKIVEVGRIFRLSGPAMIRRILLPAVLPWRCGPVSGSAGCSWSRRSSWARPRGLAISWLMVSNSANRRRSSPLSWPSPSSARRAIGSWLPRRRRCCGGRMCSAPQTGRRECSASPCVRWTA